MTKTEKITLALEHCTCESGSADCHGCPYDHHKQCVTAMLKDIQVLIAANEQAIEAAKNLLELRTRERDQAYLDITALETQLGELLSYATDGRYSKTTYSLSDMKRCIDESREIECEKCDELERIKQERDAAVKDMRKAQAMACYICKHYYQIEPGHRKYGCKVFGDHWFQDDDEGALWCGHFEWRGAKEAADD